MAGACAFSVIQFNEKRGLNKNISQFLVSSAVFHLNQKPLRKMKPLSPLCIRPTLHVFGSYKIA